MTRIHTAVAKMYKEPYKGSEVVSEALYGEEVAIIEEGRFSLVKTFDGYLGYIDTSEMMVCPSYQTDVKVTHLFCPVYRTPNFTHAPLLTLTYGVRLKLTKLLDKKWVEVQLVDGTKGYILRGNLTENLAPLTLDEVVDLAKKHQNLPYLWGGRSSFGYDCSGLVQFLYKEMGVTLPRDAKDQVCFQGFERAERLEKGVCLFLGEHQECISHTAFALTDRLAIQATLENNKHKVVISDLSDPEWQAVYPYSVFKRRKICKNP